MEDKNQRTEPEIEALLDYANSIIATLREPFLVLDKNLRVISANQSFYTTFEVAGKDVIGQLLTDLGNRQWNIPKLLQLLKEIIPERKVVKDYEVDHKFEKIGERVMILNACQLRVFKQVASLMAVGAAAAEEELILLAIEDITERKRLQEELKGSEECYRRAFETSQDVLLLVHKTKGGILNSNESAQELLGYPHEELLKKKLWEVGVTKDAKDFQGVVTKLERDGVMHYEDIPIKTKKGRSINSEVFLMDRAKVIQCNIRDITKRKQADNLKEEFIRIVSHELRTPLTVIREGVSQVLDGILGDTTAKQREFLSVCLTDIDRLERIIQGLLDMSKVEAGKVQLKKGWVDIISITKGIVSFFGPKAKEKGLELKVNYSEEKIYAYVDADKIIQVFTNLVGNALKFTEKGGIGISVEEKGNNIECAVADTGIGISSKNLGRAFRKFQQFGRVAGAGEKGTGLGLSITKGIVELHNGKIWVESEINKGSKFCFTLPKYTKEEILYESIESNIEIAKKEGKELSLLLFKFDNYKEAEKIYGKEKLQELFLMISGSLKEVVRSAEFVIEGSADEIILLEEVSKQNIPRMNARLKRAIKESIFEFEKERKINFSQGYATYPDDATDAKGLLKKARLAMVSESRERLKKHIMIVDDEPVVIDALERLLSKLGYSNFIKAHDGDEALAKIKNLAPDLVILDMKIPKMDGYMVAGKLKEDANTKDTPILIMSGYKVETDRLKNHAIQGSIPMLEKPFSIEQLDRMVYYLL